MKQISICTQQAIKQLALRAKISFLAKQLRISEKEAISIASRLRLAGEPVSIDLPTEEVIYDPTLLPPSVRITKVRKPSMTSYEKLTVILTILGILISVIIAFLK